MAAAGNAGFHRGGLAGDAFGGVQVGHYGQHIFGHSYGGQPFDPFGGADYALGYSGGRFAGGPFAGGLSAPDGDFGFSSDLGRGLSARDYVDFGGYGYGRGQHRSAPEQVLSSTAFEIPLGAGPGGTKGGDRSWSIWGSGDSIRFDGPDRGDSSFDGRSNTLYFGVDGRIGERWLVGLAVSATDARGDYGFVSTATDAGGASGDGALRSDLVTAMPYLRYGADGGKEFWVAFGTGSGDAELDRRLAGRPDIQRDSSHLSLTLGLAGGRWSLASRGTASLALIGDLGFARLETGDGVGAINGLEADVSQLRLGLEFSRSFAAGGGSVTPFGELAGRRDGGDGETGPGLEVAGGLRFRSESGRVGIEVRARTLAIHDGSGGYRETGYGLTATVLPCADGSGLSLSLTPTWGRPDAGALWQPGSSAFGAPFALGADRSLSLRSQASYGFRLGPPGALIAPFGELTSYAGGDLNSRGGLYFGLERPRFLLGAELSSGSSAGFGLHGYRDPSDPAANMATDALTHRLVATLRLGPQRNAPPAHRAPTAPPGENRVASGDRCIAPGGIGPR